MNDVTLSFNSPIAQGQQQNEKILDGLKATAELDVSTMSQAELKATRDKTQEFEAIFIKMMFNEMRKGLKPTESSSKALEQGKDIFNEMLYDEYAKNLSKSGGIGLADMLYRQLTTPKISVAQVAKMYKHT